MRPMESFVVRVHTPADPLTDGGDEPPQLRGVVQHVHTGHSRTFRDAEELHSVIAEETARAIGRAGSFSAIQAGDRHRP